MYCENCGGMMVGDGYRSVLHCEYAEWDDYAHMEPDAKPVYCAPHPCDVCAHKADGCLVNCPIVPF